MAALALNTMNQYCKHTIERFYSSFKSRSFDQDDVAHFFVTIRDYSEKKGIIREIGDFLAHPKLKDRGIVLNNINEIMPAFEKDIFDEFQNNILPEGRRVFKGIDTRTALIVDLESIFSQAGINFEKISYIDLSYRDFIFCIIFLLGDFKLSYNSKTLNMEVIYSHSLTLRVNCESSKYPRVFASLPVIRLENVWVSCPSMSTFVENKLEHYIARRMDQGYLGAISYEIDKSTNKYDANGFGKGEVWPLPNLN